MTTPSKHDRPSGMTRRRRYGLAAAVASTVLLTACPVLAQGWWPWSNSEPERPPVPEEPVYRPDEAPPPGQAPSVDWSTRNPICLQLEQRLVQDGQRTNQSRNVLPGIEAQIRQTEQTMQASERDLDRRDCYEYFLFSKTLRRTRTCVNLAREKEQAKRQLADLEAQRQQILSSSERSYRDDIIRELARNNCGENYTREARRQTSNPFASIWQDEEGGSSYSNNWTPYGAQSYATYRTVCVRLCDGYYFPVSFSTLPSHFEQDAAVCQNKCAAPAELYYYQNPGATVDQSVALHSQEPYTSLRTAFRYRKELVQGCSCKQTEFHPEGKPGTAASIGDPGAGWAARSEWEAQSQTQPQTP